MMRTAPTTRTKKAGNGTKKVTKKAPSGPTTDEKDDYIVNLKGQIYLLTIENEMLKKTISTTDPNATFPAATGMDSFGKSGLGVTRATAFNASVGGKGATGVSSAVGQGAGTALGGTGIPGLTFDGSKFDFPPEISDAFEVMRAKYAQLEAKYKQDLAEARHGAEAFSTQCAAQVSLITTLKKELAATNAVLASQKEHVADVESRTAADLEFARRDIQKLKDRIQELTKEKEASEQAIQEFNAPIGQMQTALVSSQKDRDVQINARGKLLASYGRQFVTSRILLKCWRNERWKKQVLQESFNKLRNEKAEAEKKAIQAEAEAEIAKAAQAEALAVADRALQALREQYSKLKVEHEKTLDRLTEGEREIVELKKENEAMDAKIAEMYLEYEESKEVASQAIEHKQAMEKYASDLNVVLTEKIAEADAMRLAASSAETKHIETEANLEALEVELVHAKAKISSLEATGAATTKSLEALTAEYEQLAQNKARADAVIIQLQEELSKRPPIDLIRDIDVESLLQRNLQAAAAMQQLLAWQTNTTADFASTLKETSNMRDVHNTLVEKSSTPESTSSRGSKTLSFTIPTSQQVDIENEENEKLYFRAKSQMIEADDGYDEPAKGSRTL